MKGTIKLTITAEGPTGSGKSILLAKVKDILKYDGFELIKVVHGPAKETLTLEKTLP